MAAVISKIMNYLNIGVHRQLFLFVLVFKLTNLHGQVLVHEEPRHHTVFQNKQIRILNVLIPPSDTSQYHIHATPSLFIRISSTTTGSQLQGGKASSGKSIAGSILFENLAPPNTRTHRVWNADKDTFHVMDVELLFKNTGFVQNPLTLPDLKLEVDTAWVRAYRLTLFKGRDFMLRNTKQSFILISLSASTIQTKQSGQSEYRELKPGGFIDIKRRHSFYLRNVTDNTVQFILLELPFQ